MDAIPVEEVIKSTTFVRRGTVGQLLDTWEGSKVMEMGLDRPCIDTRWDTKALRRSRSL